MISNPKYMDVCAGVAQISDASEPLKTLVGDGCGQLLPLELQQRMNKAIEHGTDTVATTYALYQLKVVIPKMQKADRPKAVEAMKDAVKGKKALLGKSLDDECVRLVS